MREHQQFLLALLFLGHVLGDFAFQTRAMVEGKAVWRASAFRRHTLVVLGMHAITVLPVFPAAENLLLVIFIAVSHLLIDLCKTLLGNLWERPFSWFALDQLAHVAVLFVLGGLVGDLVPCVVPNDAVGPMRAISIVASSSPRSLLRASRSWRAGASQRSISWAR